jgi:hypothetical protein
MKLLVYGSGFPRRYRNDPEELRCGKPKEIGGNPKCIWSPASIDFSWLGRSSGGATPVGTIAELLAVLRSKPSDSIEELRIIGHANDKCLALAGTIIPDNVQFAEPAMIGDSATFNSYRSAFRSIQDRFKSDGRVVLAGCGEGGGGKKYLLDMVSHTMLRTVAGFTGPITYAIEGSSKGLSVTDTMRRRGIRPQIGNDAVITLRGKVMYSTAANTVEDIFGADAVGTAVLRMNAWELQPDADSKAGDIFDVVRRCKSRPDVISAAEVGFRMKDEFYPYIGDVSGMGFAAELSGLRVVEDRVTKGKMSIDVGKGFIDRITPTTLEQRVRELGTAIEMTAQHRVGVIAAAA